MTFKAILRGIIHSNYDMKTTEVSTDRQTDKEHVYLCTMEDYSAIKKKRTPAIYAKMNGR